MSNKAPLMTDAEAACFKAARNLQRADVIDGLVNTLIPSLPMYREAMQRSVTAKTVYFVLIILGLPFLIVVWALRLLFTLLIFPYRYFSTYFLPPGFQPPGERNIQGMHSAFSKYVNLSTRRYVYCVNTWAKILYGENSAKKYSLENYIDSNLLMNPNISAPEANHLRNSLRIAREQISRELGYY